MSPRGSFFVYFIECTGVVGISALTFSPVMASTVLAGDLADTLPFPSWTGVLGVIVTIGGLNFIIGTEAADLRGGISSVFRFEPINDVLFFLSLGVNRPLVLGKSANDGTAVLNVCWVAMLPSAGHTLLSCPLAGVQLYSNALNLLLYFLLFKNMMGFTALLSKEIQAQVLKRAKGTFPSVCRSMIFTIVYGAHNTAKTPTIINSIRMACRVVLL